MNPMHELPPPPHLANRTNANQQQPIAFKTNTFYQYSTTPAGGCQPGGVENVRTLNQHEHIGYLRSRHAPTPVALPGYTAASAMDPRLRECVDQYQTGMGSPGQFNVYRSRSDETLSTVSSRPSHQHHRVVAGRECRVAVQDAEQNAAWRAWNEQNVNTSKKPTTRVLMQTNAVDGGREENPARAGSVKHRRSHGGVKSGGSTAAPPAQPGSSESCGESSGLSAAGPPLGRVPEHIEATVVLVRDSTEVSSNPDSGYSGKPKVTASGSVASTVPGVRDLASSEYSSVHSVDEQRCNGGGAQSNGGSVRSNLNSVRSDDVTTNTDDASIASSDRSDSHVSLCNSV